MAESTRNGAADSTAGTVIVTHGLWMPGRASTLLLRRRLEAAGFATVVFSYASVMKGLDENAARLAEVASALSARRLHFVGHSLGGVVIVRMLERHPELRGSQHLGRAVCLGSPLAACHGGAVLLAHGWGAPIVGRSIADLVACGGLAPWDGACELGILAGDRALGFGRLLGGLPLPNDGTVAVEETRLPGADAHRVLHVTHVGLLSSREVAAETACFLLTGRFSTRRPAFGAASSAEVRGSVGS